MGREGRANKGLTTNLNDVQLKSEEDITPQGPEPEHDCCKRLLALPLAVISAIPSLILAPLLLAEPLAECVCLLVCKVTICKYCCPHSVHNTFRNCMCAPCRYTRICCCGVGHFNCTDDHEWPFRT